MKAALFGWSAIARLGLVQAALGSIVVLATSTMNRVMVVELALPAILPGALVGLHYAVQILRPRFGFGSDIGGRRTPWIIGGIATLGAGAVLAALAIAWMETSRVGGIVAAFGGFVLIGAGVGAAGTSLLVLLAKRVDAPRRAAAATAVWLMMIAGFVITTIIVGKLLDPYSAVRLVELTAAVSAIALALTLVAVAGLEGRGAGGETPMSAGSDGATAKPPFLEALAQVWGEPQARRFTVFVFVSMLAYSGQELILEPFAGSVFSMTPGQSTQLSGVQHGGVLVGMLLVNLACAALRGSWIGSLRTWTVLGCVASALALVLLSIGGSIGQSWPLTPNVFVLGVANGAFAVAAIGSMMSFAGSGRGSREGVRMGLWGAAQAVAFGLGGFLGAAGSDLARLFVASPGSANGLVFAAEALLFLAAARLAAGIGASETDRTAQSRPAITAASASRETAT
ncbi:MAG: BCD family MFS transporter [Dokdonella sp.]|uniref:BCD family MFS transporter n=1 Tax=Dokdonella sp. TaxID=2291710 RepID=UPI003267931B